jgi:hypothetical protein
MLGIKSERLRNDNEVFDTITSVYRLLFPLQIAKYHSVSMRIYYE